MYKTRKRECRSEVRTKKGKEKERKKGRKKEEKKRKQMGRSLMCSQAVVEIYIWRAHRHAL